LQQGCDVMPVPGSVMRGAQVPGVFLAARDGQGEPVAVAASFRLHPDGSKNADIAFWGMIATRPDRRGQRLARILGAMAIVHMWEKEGARGFMTGVRADNASSQALCNALGVTDSPWCYATCTDPQVMGAKITK
jgi:RimJ/RimL family protein N-acetyltransferase